MASLPCLCHVPHIATWLRGSVFKCITCTCILVSAVEGGWGDVPHVPSTSGVTWGICCVPGLLRALRAGHKSEQSSEDPFSHGVYSTICALARSHRHHEGKDVLTPDRCGEQRSLLYGMRPLRAELGAQAPTPVFPGPVGDVSTVGNATSGPRITAIIPLVKVSICFLLTVFTFSRETGPGGCVCTFESHRSREEQRVCRLSAGRAPSTSRRLRLFS